MRFWKEKSVEDTVTLGPTAWATLVLDVDETFIKMMNNIHIVIIIRLN
jgi:hypothetical protein